MADKDLVDYFMRQTEKKLDGLETSIQTINSKLDDLTKFKIEMLATSRFAAFVVSAVAGLATLTASTLISLYISDKLPGQKATQTEGTRK